MDFLDVQARNMNQDELQNQKKDVVQESSLSPLRV